MANLPPDRRIQLQSNTGTNVINGATGTAQPTATPNQPQQAQQGLTTNTQGAAPQQAQNNSQKSSGMFTNIKSYIQRNQPQAQKMAGAVTGDFSKQATQIADQAKQKEQQFKNQVQTQQGNIQSQANFAQGVIDQTKNIQLDEGQMANAETTQNVYANKPQPVAPAPVVEGQQPAPQPTGPTPEEIAKQSQDNFNKFQGIITGANEQDLYNVQDLDLSRQQNKAQQLGALAKSAGTEQGRAALLEQAFSKNRQYTTGQAGLDTAILGGNQQALKSVQDLTKQSTQGIEQDLKQKYFQSLSDRANLQSTAENLKKDVAGRVEGAMGDVVKQAESTAKTKREEAQTLQSKIQKAFQTGEGLDDESISKYLDTSNINKAKQEAIHELKRALGNEKGVGDGNRAKHYEALTGESYGKNYAKFRNTVEKSLRDPKNKHPDAIAYNKAMRDGDENKMDVILRNRTEARYKAHVNDKLNQISSLTNNDFIKQQIASGKDLSGYLSFTNPEEYNTQTAATEDQLARYEALKKLSNKTGIGELDMMKDRYVRGQEASGKFRNISAKDLYKKVVK